MSTQYLVDIEDSLHAHRQRRRAWIRVGIPVLAVLLIAAAIIGIALVGMELSQREAPHFFSYRAGGDELALADAASDHRSAEVHRIMTNSVGSKLHRDYLFRPRGFYLPRVGAAQTFILASRL